MSLKVSSAPDVSGQTGVVAADTVEMIWSHVTRVFKSWLQGEVVAFLLGSCAPVLATDRLCAAVRVGCAGMREVELKAGCGCTSFFCIRTT